MSEALQNLGQPTLESLVASRARTDSVVPELWISIPVATSSLWALIAIVIATGSASALSNLTISLGILAFNLNLLGILEMTGLLLSAATAYLVYMLVNRRNTHMAREQALFAKSLDWAMLRTKQDDLKTLLPLNSAEHGFAQLVQSSGEKSAILWGMLSMVPFVGWLAMIYVLSFLSGDLKKHELREEAIILDLDRAFRAGGIGSLPPRERRSSFRNVPGYVLVGLVCLVLIAIGLVLVEEAFFFQSVSGVPTSIDPVGISALIVGVAGLGVVLNIWLYEAMRDPQPHFAYHGVFEEALLTAQPTGVRQTGGAY